MNCNCKDWKENKGPLERLLNVENWYDFQKVVPPFKYCPWCSKPLNSEITYSNDQGIKTDQNGVPIVCSRCGGSTSNYCTCKLSTPLLDELESTPIDQKLYGEITNKFYTDNQDKVFKEK